MAAFSVSNFNIAFPIVSFIALVSEDRMGAYCDFLF